MKLAVAVSCDNEFSEAPSVGYLDVTPTVARALLDLHAAAMEFRAKVASADLASGLYSVILGNGDRIPDFRLMALSAEENDYPEMRERPVTVLPDDFDPDSIGADEYRIECHRVELDDRDVRFVALDRHGSDRHTTAEIPCAVLEAIAEGRDPELPRIVAVSCGE